MVPDRVEHYRNGTKVPKLVNMIIPKYGVARYIGIVAILGMQLINLARSHLLMESLS